MMSQPRYIDKLVRGFEIFTVGAAGLLLMMAVAVAIAVVYSLFINGVQTNIRSISSIAETQLAIQRVFSGVLLLLLGLEMLETLKTYFTDHLIRTEVILVVAMIAVGRHIVQIDFEHIPPGTLAGIASLMLALSLSYFLVRKRQLGAS